MGNHKSIETPEKFAEYFEQYTIDLKANPIKKHDFVGKDAHEVNRKLERPLTWVGFEVWLYKNGIISDISDYQENKQNRYSEFIPIIRVIKAIIAQDQLEGASAGIYAHNIIARMQGLVDKKEIENTGDITFNTIITNDVKDK